MASKQLFVAAASSILLSFPWRATAQPTPPAPTPANAPSGTRWMMVEPPAPPEASPTPIGTIPLEPTTIRPAKPSTQQVALSLNPLNLLIGRYGINAEWLPAQHHGLILSPYYARVDATVSSTDVVDSSPVVITYNNRFSGFGAELGYRYYTGDAGPIELFIGPSLLFATYKSAGDALGRSISQRFGSYGAAFDVGGQAVIGGGFVLGGGFGLQYTRLTEDLGLSDLPIAATIIAGGGWRPRFLMSIGWAF